jgi:hypothetical protein
VFKRRCQAQHTPTSRSCNNTSWINIEFSPDQCLLFRGSLSPLRLNQASLLNRVRVGSVSPILRRIKIPVAKLHSCFTICVIRVNVTQLSFMDIQASTFVAVLADDADTAVCCTIRTNYFIRDISNSAQDSSCCSSVNTCLLRVPFLSRIEPVAPNLFTCSKIFGASMKISYEFTTTRLLVSVF